MGQETWQERIERKIKKLKDRERFSVKLPLGAEFGQVISRVIVPAFQEFKEYCEQKGINVKIRIGHDPPYAHFAITRAEFFSSVSRALHFSILTKDARTENKVEIFEESWRGTPAKGKGMSQEEYIDLVAPKEIAREFVQARLVRLLERYLDAELNY